MTGPRTVQIYLRPRSLLLSLAVAAGLALAGVHHAQAEAQLLIDAATGKVLRAENATLPWYPASVTKLMTTYTALRAVKDGKIGFNSLLTVSRNAAAQQPTKMGFKQGTRVTVDNALKMLLVRSANDVAVAIAEGVGGSIEGFADMMNANAKRLGMTQSHFVNPNGLPAENHVTSARDLGILARALITEFPEDDFYWHIHSIEYGHRVMRNFNSLLDRYPGADGMKTGFICASGYNLVASATRHGRRLIAVVLGAYSGAVRARKAAQLLETRVQRRHAVVADTVARHRRRAGADRRAAAQSARRDLRRSSSQAAVGRKRRGTGRRRDRRRRALAGFHAVQPAAAERQVRARAAGRDRGAGQGLHRAGRPSRSGARRQPFEEETQAS